MVGFHTGYMYNSFARQSALGGQNALAAQRRLHDGPRESWHRQVRPAPKRPQLQRGRAGGATHTRRLPVAPAARVDARVPVLYAIRRESLL